MKTSRRIRTTILVAAALAVLGGCASDSGVEEVAGPLASEPYIGLKTSALEAYDQGQPMVAVQVIARAMVVAPDEREPFELASQFLREGGDDTYAVQVFAVFLGNLPDKPWPWYYRGIHLVRLGRWEDGLAAFDRAAALLPDDPDIQYRRGLVLAALDRKDEALEALRAARAADPASADIASRLAEILLESGDVDGAEQVVTAGLAADPGSAALHYDLALLHLERGDSATAVEALEKAIELNPTHVEAHRRLSALYSEAGRGSEAARHERMAARIEDYRIGRQVLIQTAVGDPEPGPALAVAELELAEGNHRAALRWFAEAERREAEAEADRIAVGRALAYFTMGDLETGDVVLAALTEPSGGRYHLARAARLLASGDEEGAREALDRAAKEGAREREFLWTVSDYYAALGDLGRAEVLREEAAAAPRATEIEPPARAWNPDF